MKLIVGLGNPGKEYENTRHNIGFMIIDNYLKKKNISCSWNFKFNGKFIKTSLNGENVLFLKPQAFMNLSGGVVKKYIDYFKISIDDVLIISDDLDIKVGNFKLKSKGSSGGHNGLKDIEKSLNTNIYRRLKIGISNDKNIDTKDYVLGKLTKQDLEKYAKLNDIIEKLLDDYLNLTFEELMNIYNKKNR